jgi:hypothetical protein
VRIELLLVGQRLEVRSDAERDDGGRAVSQVLLECLGIYAGRHVGLIRMHVVERRVQL